MNKDTDLRGWSSLRPPSLADRKEELREIKEAFEKGGKAVVILGKGGIGKTRILEELCNKEWKNGKSNFTSLGIFDVYHSSYHRISGVEKAIVDGVRKTIDKDAFEGYEEARNRFTKAREKGMPSLSLSGLREAMSKAFWDDFRSALGRMGNRHLVLCFDTMELLFHEADNVERLLGERPHRLELADWLAKAARKDLPNLHFLLAGRPERKWWEEFQAYASNKPVELGGLNEEGVKEYLEAVGLRDSDPEIVWKWTRGEPLRLVFVTMLIAARGRLPQPPVTDEKIDKTLIEEIMRLTDDMSIALPYIALLSKGATPELLSVAMGDSYPEWDERKAKGFLGRLRNMPFVKIRPSDDRIFLHDEMYRVMRKYVLNAWLIEMKDASEKVVEYYEKHPELPGSERVYYKLYWSWKEGFDEYRRLSDEAIAEHRVEDDMLLRDEVFRFINDYGFTNLRPQVDKDAIIRWVKRLLAMAEYRKAMGLAAEVRKNGIIDGLDEEEKAVFSVYEAEAESYAGLFDHSEYLLERARNVLEGLEAGPGKVPSYEKTARLQAKIRAFNNIGYIQTRKHDYWSAAEWYKKALMEYGDLPKPKKTWTSKVKRVRGLFGEGLLNDWADTLKNLAFVYSRLGFSRSAYQLASESNKIYSMTNNEYGHGLAMSTMGAIFSGREWYCSAQRVLKEALKVFQPGGIVPDKRAEAIVSLELGQALRKSVDMENLEGRENEFWNILDQSEAYLMRAEGVLEREEPSRLADVLHALGCLYRDMLAFKKRVPGWKGGNTLPPSSYRSESIKYLESAFGKAASDLQKADILIDKAEVCYHYYYEKGYRKRLGESAEKDINKRLERAENLVPESFRYPYRGPYPTEEQQRQAVWWQVMSKINLLKGHVSFKEGKFKEAIEEYLESFLFLDLYSEEALELLVTARSGRRLYSKFSRVGANHLGEMKNVLMQKGDKRHIMDRLGWKMLLSLVQDIQNHTQPYVLEQV